MTTDSSSAARVSHDLRPALVVGAASSAMAGLVHTRAVLTHDGDSILALGFVLCAMAQLLWALAAAIRPIRTVLLIGAAINLGAVVAWAVSRTIGVGFIEPLAGGEPVGRPDLTAALLAGASALATLRLLFRPRAVRRVTLLWTGALACLALVATLPALAAGHDHSDAGESAAGHPHAEVAAAPHGHDDGATTDDDAHADDAHADEQHGTDDAHAGDAHSGDEHGSSHTADATGTHGHAEGDGAPVDHGHDPSAPDTGHAHPDDPADPEPPHDHPDDPADPEPPHDHPDDPEDPVDPEEPDPITSIDDPRVTEDQFNAALALLIDTMGGMSGYLTEEQVVAAGYESIGDGDEPGEYEHFINWGHLTDEYELDPTRIEAIVMKYNADGTKRVVAAMYMLTTGDTIADAPDIAGELTSWHDHDGLCFDGTQLVARAVGGVCPSGVLMDLPPMLYVWIEPNPCGEFAVIDETGHDCGAVHTH